MTVRLNGVVVEPPFSGTLLHFRVALTCVPQTGPYDPGRAGPRCVRVLHGQLIGAEATQVIMPVLFDHPAAADRPSEERNC